MSAAEALDTLGTRRKLGRASRYPGQLWQVPTFFIGLGMFLLVAVTSPMRQDWSIAELVEELTRLREALEPGAESPETLVLRAENLLARSFLLPRRSAEIHFVAGSAYFRLAQSLSEEHAGPVRSKAVEQFEEANSLGVSMADSAALSYRLGVMLFLQEKTSRRALDLLVTSVDKGADQPAEGYGYLIQAYLHMPKPRLDAALLASQKQLDLIDERDLEALAQARLLRVSLLLRKEQRHEALLELERIGPNSPRQPRIRARLLQTDLYEEEGLPSRAIALWNELLPEADFVPGGKARILYALGSCHEQDDPPNHAAAQEAWQRALALGGDDGQAAGLRLGELLLSQSPPDVSAALTAWTEALARVNLPSEYRNKRVDLARARDMLEKACSRFLENQDFERTQLVVAIYKKIAQPGMAEERLAQAAEFLAQDMKEKAAKGAGFSKEDVAAQFHRAGVAYEQAAAVRAASLQEGDLWRSALCYLEARDFSQAGTVLEKFVKFTKDENRLAEAWLHLANASLAVGHRERARQAYYKCIEFPSTPFAYRARYQLARGEIDKENFEQAREILEQNLRDVVPSADREAYEKSLYMMARLLMKMRSFDRAFLFLEQAVRQYPANPEALVCRDQLAECYRQLAENDANKLAAAKGEDARAQHRQSRLKWLERACVAHQQLADILEKKAKESQLTSHEMDLMRRALFGVADDRFLQREFAEALQRYQILQERFRGRAEGLIACQKIWHCVGVMVATPEEARLARNAFESALKLAQTDLDAMPADGPAFRGGAGVWTKAEWQDWLNRANADLHPKSPPTSVMQ